MAATINDLVCQLSSDSVDVEETLSQLKTAVYILQLKELKDIVKTLPLNHIFAKLHVSSSNELKISKAILDRLLECLEPDVIYSQFRDEILSGLCHQDDDIMILCLTQIKRYVNCGDAIDNLICDIGLLQAVIRCLGVESLAVAKVASSILSAVGNYPVGIGVMFANPLLEEFKENMKKTDVVRYRVYDVVTSIAVSNPDAFDNGNLSDILHMLMSEVTKDDILVQMNSIEMISSLAVTKNGLSYLEKHGIVALIKFFGSLACHDPKEICEKHRTFLKTTFDLLGTEDAVVRGVVVDTIGIIASSLEGKFALNKQGECMRDVMKQLGHMIKHPPIEVKKRALICLVNIFSIAVEQQNDDVLSMLENWFCLIDSSPLDIILSICQQPFQELRCPALAIINAIANQSWGQALLNLQPGFKEYLLDRSTENEKSGKVAKYKIVETLVETSTTCSYFGSPYYIKLKKFKNEGPFYVQTETEVAVQRE
ncbi:26S proteasome non-ATPase regulatory subunit 5-like isoform X2 [Anneissia japonica]|uniref:26S proteasome non-ATPase regulatory subunit 5-like isoform X2 n=1 Tax=Anneissia japonica TaxID=1529436 RepID=UPI0014257815|nr:26S proteasome non-ATPase regulatory subunit 5-like isoform X2 [Anneissia japonica]